MAGDVKETRSGDELPVPDYADPFPGILETLNDIRDALRGVESEGPGMFELNFGQPGGVDSSVFGRHDWQRMRTQTLVIWAETQNYVGIQIGSRQHLFFAQAGVNVIPFVRTIERGADLFLIGAADNIHGYLIATPE